MVKFGPTPYFLVVAACVTLWFALDFLPAQPAGQSQTAPTAPSAAKSHLRQALPRRQYLCANGVSIVALLEPNAVRLTMNGQIHNLKQIESNSGTKYSDGLVVWSVSGDVGSLQDVSAKDQPKYLAQNCMLQRSFPPTAIPAGTVLGSITLPKGIDLSPEAEVIVELHDIFPANAPSPTVAEYKVSLGHPEGPIPFKLRIDPAKIDPKHRYAVEVRVLAGGQLRATNEKEYLVLTQGNSSQADIVLVAVARRIARP
jgi:putative lipoprotein